MRAILKYPAKMGKILLPKGTEGKIVAISNYETIKDTFPNLSEKPNGTYYIIKFEEFDECLFDKSQIEII